MIKPDPCHLLLDSRLTNEEVQNISYTYNNIREALSDRALRGAAGEQPVTVYIAPGVYWLEDPQSDAVIMREDSEDLYPYGCKVNCGNLRLVGLSENAEDVVIAANRGNDHGAKGNYTLFHFSGENLEMENLTLGNYCCVDLDYTLDPALSVKKRTEAITQAQLADTNADKFHAKNCRFVSRLNLYPVCGANRSLYEHCHFEQTDDALNGNAVYLDCDFDFYSGMPIYEASGTGAVFLDCTFYCKYPQDGEIHAQYFTKVGGQIALIGSSFVSRPDTNVAVSWTKYPSVALKCYQVDVSYPEGRFTPVTADVHTVDIAGKALTNAYFITKDGEKLYNVYNLLGGKDDWDPLGNGEEIRAAGKTDLPTQLLLDAETYELEAGGSPGSITAKCLTFDGRKVKRGITFKIEGDVTDFIEVQRISENSCLLQFNHSNIGNIDHEMAGILTAQTEEGLQTGAYVRIHPRKVPAPTFTVNPVICRKGKMLQLSYDFAEAEKDRSDIIWYRSKDIQGEDKIMTAVSQPGRPEKTYALTGDDAGYYIFAQIRPGTDHSEYGEAVQCLYERIISMEEVETDRIRTDFHNLPLRSYAGNIKGVWNFDAKRPEDTYDFEKWDREKTEVPWHYGVTGDGSKGEGLYQGMQGARIRYTPATDRGGAVKRNMEVLLEADPAKSAGQGFGSAGQYLDVCLKMDTDTLDGCGLRILRTTAHSDAVTMYLIQYVHGRAKAISEGIVTSCFVTGCRIRVRYENGRLSAKAWSAAGPTAAQREKSYAREVELTAEVDERESTDNNGLLLWHTGSLGTENWRNTTMLHGVSILYF